MGRLRVVGEDSRVHFEDFLRSKFRSGFLVTFIRVDMDGSLQFRSNANLDDLVWYKTVMVAKDRRVLDLCQNGEIKQFNPMDYLDYLLRLNPGWLEDDMFVFGGHPHERLCKHLGRGAVMFTLKERHGDFREICLDVDRC